MTRDEAVRPSPEALLKAAQKEGRGRLKVFLGAAPGVGKTYAMLRAAHRQREQGVDVCVGLIETHGRRETEGMLQGLELLPRTALDYRGRDFQELDVAAILQRRPKLVLVDELAHSNIPGASHPKRHQDIDDLLDAGIDVYTTLNVQHLESLNDVVARITGVQVRETVPDEVLEEADEIELIDLPPEDLIQRLKDGKVYVPEQARQALNQFFGRGALTALRELALRAAAEQIDAQMLEYKRRHAVDESWPTRERLLVCVNETDISQQVVRAARRLAEHRRVPWIAVHVETSRALALPEAAKDRIARNLRLAERLGAETLTVPGNDLVAELLTIARSRNVSQIVVGRPARRRFRLPGQRTIAGELVRLAAPLEVTIVTWAGNEEVPPPSQPILEQLRGISLRPYLLATAATVLATLVALWAEEYMAPHSLGVLFLVAVLVVATRLGLWPSLYTSGLSAVLFNFLFTEPKFTLLVADADDFAALISFLIVALLAGNLGGRLRQQLEAQKNSARQARELTEFSQRLAGAAEIREVVRAIALHLENTHAPEAVVMLPDAEARLLVEAGSSNLKPLGTIDHAAAKWALEHDEATGAGTDTLPAAGWLFLPLTTARTHLGVLGVRLESKREPDADERRLLASVADLAAIAIERTQLAADLEQSRVLTETEQLRAALLSSVSHDLRTPLVSVLGAADSLLHHSGATANPEQRELAETILEEAERLNRFVQNLLDMTRLSYGGLKPRLDWCDFHDLVAAARDRLARVLAGRELQVDIADDLPLLWVDPVLIEQVLVNLLDNALKYSPADQPVRIVAAEQDREIVVRISDRGVGIPEADRERVFDMFYRARAGDQRIAGTGLGLAICRGLLQAHGGRIVAMAGEGDVGTVIELRLPLRSPPPQPEE